MREIQGYEGLYSIDPAGNVVSISRLVKGADGVLYPRGGIVLKPGTNKQTGYLQVDLWKANKGTKFAVHRLVAEAFIPNPDGKLEVNHKDGNRANPAMDNLEWVTSSENSYHAYRHGAATQEGKRKLTEQDYLVIFERFLKGEAFASILKDFTISPGRLSVNLRKYAHEWGREHEYKAEVYRQQKERAAINGKN